MHGSRGGAKAGVAHPNWKHGGRSADAIAIRKLVSTLGRDARDLAEAIDSPKNESIAALKGDI